MMQRLKQYIGEFGRMVLKDHHPSRWFVLVFDLLIVLLSSIFITSLTLNSFVNPIYLNHNYTGLVGLSYLLMFLLYGTNNSLLRHTSIFDITKIIAATSSAVILFLTLNYILNLIFRITNSYSIIEIIIFQFFVVNVILIGIRIFIEAIYKLSIRKESINNKNILIFGAGSVGLLIRRAFIADDRSKFVVSGFIDDNIKLTNKTLNGLRIDLFEKIDENFIKEKKISAIIIAVKEKNISVNRRLEIIEKSANLGIEVFELPKVDLWINAGMDVKQIKKVTIEALLGRETINLNFERINKEIKDKIILVTGAAGSIGSEISRTLVKLPIKQLILLDQSETGLFDLKNELSSEIKKNPDIEIILGDVSNRIFLTKIFNFYRPNIVFNAAAYKHVPICESQPHEAVRVNIMGTVNLADLSIVSNVEKFVMISTDKAVNPTNVMGSTKRIAEMYIQILSANKSVKTQFITTRFGNVLGSNGSVVKTFEQQIKKGGPITVTHPEITRYFMTIPEASQLVIEAGFIGKGGEIFIFDMGKPHKISDLACEMIKQYGYEPGQDIEIIYTGLRPGEKLYEELLTKSEENLSTHNPKIYISKARPLESSDSINKIKKLIENLYIKKEIEIVEELKELVPEYISNNSIYCVLDNKRSEMETNY
jgi:FlaA1/EpsC-like NDP-sugar epimerase